MTHVIHKLFCILGTSARSLFLLGTAISSSAFGQQLVETAPPDFFVQLSSNKSVFYADEVISYAVSRRADKPESAGCSLSFNTKFQVLRNGEVIHQGKFGALSSLAAGKMQGVQYLGFGTVIVPYQFVPTSEASVNDTYQIRAVCGDEVSTPSKPFHIDVWNRPVDGLQVFIRPLKNAYRIGEPIVIEATMRNLGNRARLCPIPLPDDGYKMLWSLGSPWQDSRPEFDYSDFFERRLGLLKPGESRTVTFALNHFRDLSADGKPSFGSRPGKYRVSFRVYFYNDDPPQKYRKHLWRGELGTNGIEVNIL